MGCSGCRTGSGARACNCVLQAGANAFVTGSGTAADPYVISAAPEVPDTALAVQDTSTLDLTLTGDGSVGNPYTISGLVIGAPPTPLQVTDTPTLDLTLTGAGTPGNPYILSGVAAAQGVLTVTDTPTLDLTLTGTGTTADPYVLSGVATDPATGLAVTDTATLDLTLTGTGAPGDPYTLSGAVVAPPVNVSDTLTLDLTRTGSGTPADPYVISGVVTPPGFSVTDGEGLDLTLTGDGTPVNPWNLTGQPVVDPEPNNMLSLQPLGLFAQPTIVQAADSATLDLSVAGTGTTADPYIISGTVLGGGGGATALGVVDTQSVDMTLTGDGSAGNPYSITSEVIVDPAPGNMLASSASGLVAVPTALQVTDTPSLDLTLTGTGQPATPYNLSAAVEIDSTGNNMASAGADGIYVPPTLLTVTDTPSLDLTLSGSGQATDPYVLSGVATGGGAATEVEVTNEPPDGAGGVLGITGDGTPATPYEIAMQESILRRQMTYIIPKHNNSGLDTIGCTTLVRVGADTAAAKNPDTKYGRARKVEELVTVAATNAVAGVRHNDSDLVRGVNPQPPFGGFYYKHIWAPATGVANATWRAFCGLIESVAAPTDVNPSTLVNMIGMGWDAADANAQLMFNDGTGAATKVDLGAPFFRPTIDRDSLFSIELWCDHAEAMFHYRARNLTSGVEVVGDTGASVDIPGGTVVLNPHGYMSVGGTSSVVGYAFGGFMHTSNGDLF